LIDYIYGVNTQFTKQAVALVKIYYNLNTAAQLFHQINGKKYFEHCKKYEISEI